MGTWLIVVIVIVVLIALALVALAVARRGRAGRTREAREGEQVRGPGSSAQPRVDGPAAGLSPTEAHRGSAEAADVTQIIRRDEIGGATRS